MTADTTDTADTSHHDLIILGGGLAGLTLALQLRQRLPLLKVLVLERRAHPVPHAAHKVGESSVEIGAHYFEHVLGLGQHLRQAQLKKFGFRFFFSDGRRDIDQVTELGASRPLPVPSWQIDRGIFENFLAEEATRRGVTFVDQAAVRQVQLSDNGGAHTVTWHNGPADAEPTAHTSTAAWVVDASGRAGLLKRQLGLALESPHAAHAIWFRVAERICVDNWSASPEWRARTATPTRWLSTNHLVGEGYWVWLIPLASGSHSVGIVADPAFHPLERMNTFERAMEWLSEHQPLLFDELQPMVAADPSKLQDFAFFRRFSHDCKQVFSAQRWALAGEAGRFLDPFYSPGSDFIAIVNTYITELVVRDQAGKPLAAHANIYDQALRSFHDSTLALYNGQYALFADAEVMPHKVIWDYTYYWGVLAHMFCQGRIADLASMSHLKQVLADAQALNLAVQAFLRDWGRVSQRRNPAVMLDQASMPWFAELNANLAGNMLDDESFRAQLRQSCARLTALAQELLERGCGEHPRLDGSALAAAISAAGGARPGFEPMLFQPLGQEELLAA